jgi:PAS domain S-box-containing protein
MEKALIPNVKETLNLDFSYFPDFAQYILHHDLERYARELMSRYEEVDVPVLRFFKSMPVDQRDALALASNREMLTLIATNNAAAYIKQSINNWLNNQLPIITRDQIVAQDITLVNFVRRNLLREYVPRYTQDTLLWLKLAEEIDRFYVILDSELFSSYLMLQQEKINTINAALQNREQQLLQAQEVGQIGSFEWDLLGKQSSFTPQMFKIFEMDGPSNLESFLEDVHPDEKEKVRMALAKALKDGDYECEYRYIRNNKEKIILSRGKVQFQDGKPVKMVGTVADVTERHTIVARLQESERLHKQAQALTHIGNWSWSVKDNVIKWSDEMYRIYGLQPQSEQITYERFLSFIDADDRENRIAEIQKSLVTLQVPEYHFRIKSADGKLKVLRGKGEMVADQNKSPLVMLGTCQDVTKEFQLTKELKEREVYLQKLNESLEAANQELIKSNKELEAFNFVASHDLQEPLRKIQIYSNRITEYGLANLPAPLHGYFDKINQASNRMHKLIDDFLVFSQTFRVSQPFEQVDLNVLMEEIKVELSARIEDKHATIETMKLPNVWAINFQVKQLLINLISNALKYTHPGVPPRITVFGEVIKSSALPANFTPAAKTYVKISIADNGIGFDEKYTTKIFELFQRLHTKDTYSGTGIGLALCKKIMDNLKGYITATSKLNVGSVFTVYIPKTEAD